jgi:serine/threonine protein kinase
MNTGSLAPQLRDLGGFAPTLRSRMLHDYELVRHLERPHPGEWWLATKRSDRQTAVLCFMARESVSDQHVALLEQELQLAMRLAPHPHIASVFAAEVNSTQLACAAAYVDGDDLVSLLSETGPMPLDAAMECVRQCLLGLRHAHNHGLAHNDLTPADLIIDFDGVLKICNWGCTLVSPQCDFTLAKVKDLRAVAKILHFLVTGSPTHTACKHDGEIMASPMATSNTCTCAQLPQELQDFCARLETSGVEGFTSAEDAIAACDLISADPEIAIYATEPAATSGIDSVVRSLHSVVPAAPEAKPVSHCESESPVASSASGEGESENARASVLATGVYPSVSRGRWFWLCGVLFAIVVAVLATVGYLLW